MTIVIDASVALAWCFEDEASPTADRVLDAVVANGAVVPQIWPFEVTNVLLQAERKDRISLAEVSNRLAMLEGLPIEVDLKGGVELWKQTFDLARSERLTVYDASYLELAMRKGAALSSKDVALLRAAERCDVAVEKL